MLEQLKHILEAADYLKDEIFVLALLALLAFHLRAARVSTSKVYLRGAVVVVCDSIGVGLCVVALLAAVGYLIYPGYLDHLEALIAATSWLSLHGGVLHPWWERGQGLYGILYGPAIDQLAGLGLYLSPTIVGSKVVSFAAVVLGVVFLALTMRSIAVERRLWWRLLIGGIVLAGNSDYWLTNRADAILIALVSFSCYVAVRWRSASAVIAMGIAAGLAANMKIHACLYFVPPAVLWLDSVGLPRQRWRFAFAGVASGVIAWLAPFLMSGASLPGYLRYLRLATNQGFDGVLLLQTLGLDVTLGALLLAVVWIRRPLLSSSDRIYMVALALAMLLVTIVASKAGSGSHHLQPFVPVVMVAFARLLVSPLARPGAEPIPASAALKPVYVALLATLGLFAFINVGHVARVAVVERPLRRAELQELLRLSRNHPEAEMGVTDLAHYEDTFLYPALIFHGGEMLFSPGAWMDLQQGGVSDAAAIALVADCRIKAWILPAEGRPFALRNFYSGRQMFSAAFVRVFSEHYSNVEAGNYYDLWVCRTGTLASGAPQRSLGRDGDGR